MVIFAVALITTIFYFIIKPSPTELLAQESWCVDKIYYKGQQVGPKTRYAIYLRYKNGQTPCIESATFRQNGDLNLPGLNTRIIDGTWKLIDADSIKLETDTLQKILTGAYKISIEPNQLRLQSVCTEIYCHKDNTPAPDFFKV